MADLTITDTSFRRDWNFAIETHVVEIAAAMKTFFAANGAGRLQAERTA
jgi:hypothetical protein